MSDYRNINIALEILGGLISSFIVICILTSPDKNSRSSRPYIKILLCNLAALAFDALAWYLDGAASAYAAAAVRAAKFAAYSLSYLLLPLLTEYMAALFGVRDNFLKTVTRCMYAGFAVNVLLITLSQFNGMYYFYDANNHYSAGGMFWLSQVTGAFWLLVNAALLFMYRKRLGKLDAFFLSAFFAFPLIAVILQMFMFSQLELLFAATTLSTISVYANIQVRQAKLLQAKELELARARVDVILARIQPHFLYNALTAIKCLCEIDPAAAADTVVDFSKYLRGNLNSLTHDGTIPFERELEHVKSYLSIEQKRFVGRLKIVYDITAQDFALPAMTLQHITENAVRHSITQTAEPCVISIVASKTDVGVFITVTDDGAGFDPKHPSIITGIESVQSRLSAMCGGTLTVRREERGMSAAVFIPDSQN